MSEGYQAVHERKVLQLITIRLPEKNCTTHRTVTNFWNGMMGGALY